MLVLSSFSPLLCNPGLKPREWYSPRCTGLPISINVKETIPHSMYIGQPDLGNPLPRLSP